MKFFVVGLVFLLIIFIIFPAGVFAKIGVGVGTGKIQVDEQLKPGIIYKLPSLTVINTGNEPSDYGVSIAYHQDIPQLRPKQNWFIFTPQKFYLKPGEVKVVDIKLNLPLRTEPGEYFAYLEAQPVIKAEKGKTTIGVAAAAKLYFTVVPANIFYGMYYKIVSFWKVYAPWPQRVIILLVIGMIYLLARKYLKINIGLKKPQAKITRRDIARRSRLRRLGEFRQPSKKDE